MNINIEDFEKELAIIREAGFHPVGVNNWNGKVQFIFTTGDEADDCCTELDIFGRQKSIDCHYWGLDEDGQPEEVLWLDQKEETLTTGDKASCRQVKIKLLSPLAKIPFKAHSTDACYDVVATSKEEVGEGVWKYGLGFAVELPENTRLDLRPRSSIYKTGLVLSNSVGTGDEGYTGEYCAYFYHVLKHLPEYNVGDRILQIHVESRSNIAFEEVQELGVSDRGSNGFGSSGK